MPSPLRSLATSLAGRVTTATRGDSATSQVQTPSEYDGALPALDLTQPPWPGSPEVVQINHRGTRRQVGIYVRRTPGPTDAPRMFYVHGLGGSSTNWTDLATLMSQTVDGYSIDLPGYGRSDPAPGEDYSIAAQARYVAAVIEAGGPDPVHLVGNSMGGLISIELAATRPDLVRTLSLVSPAVPFYKPPRGSDPRLPLLALPGIAKFAEKKMAAVDPEVRARAVIDLCFGDPSNIPDSRIEESIEEARERAGLPWAGPAFTQSLRAIIGSFLRPRRTNPWRLAASIDVPTVLIWGDQDRLVSVTLSERLARTIPDSRLLVLPGVGHTAQLEAPEVTARAILGTIHSAHVQTTRLSGSASEGDSA